MIKKLLILILLLPLVQAQTPQNTGLDPNILRFIQQEELKTRSEIKTFMTAELTANQDKIQEQVEFNKKIIYKDLDKKAQLLVFRMGVVWFIATLTALICYRFIILAVKRKYVKKGLRDEFYG